MGFVEQERKDKGENKERDETMIVYACDGGDNIRDIFVTVLEWHSLPQVTSTVAHTVHVFHRCTCVNKL